MEPQNKNERRSVFQRFLALFIAGILLVTIPFYFTIRLPDRENKLTSEELQILQEQVNFQRDYFAVRIDSVSHLLEGYESKNTDIDMLNADIGFILSEMGKSISANTSWRYAMNENIIQAFLGLKKATNELSECRNNLKTAKASRPANSLDPL